MDAYRAPYDGYTPQQQHQQHQQQLYPNQSPAYGQQQQQPVSGGGLPGGFTPQAEQVYGHDGQCISTIIDSLSAALDFYHKGQGAPGGPDSATTIAESMELLELFIAVVQTNDAPDRLQYLLFHLPHEAVGVITAFIQAPLLYSPDGASGYPLQQAFVQLRVAVIQTLKKVCIACCRLVDASSIANPDLERLSKFFTDGITSCRLVPSLFNLLTSPSTHESIRVCVSEILFVIIVRSPAGRSLVVNCNGVAGLLNCVVLEPSVTVRQYIGSCLRELAVEFAPEFHNANGTGAFLKLLTTDESAEVRTMCAESLAALVLGSPDLVWPTLEQQKDLLTTIHQRLEKEHTVEVLEAVCRLIETCALTAATKARGNNNGSGVAVGSPFFDSCMSHALYRPLVQCLQQPNRAAAMAARALRFLIQLCPANHQVGHRIITHFQSLSTIFTVIMENYQQHDRGDQDVAAQTLQLELAIGLSLILAQSPVHRAHILRELHAFPLWTTSLRDAVLGFLNLASLDYYSGIDVVDVTGTPMNDIRDVEWSDGNKPKKASIRFIFEQQEQRVNNHRMEPRPVLPITLETDMKKKMRLTFILLSYATHLALGLADASHSMQEEDHRRKQDHHNQYVAAHEFPHHHREQSYHGGDGYAAEGYGASQAQHATPVRRGASTRSTTPSQAYRDPYASPGAGYGGAQGAHTGAVRDVVRPMFPSAKSPGPEFAGRKVLTPYEQDEMAQAYDKFDSAFKLTVQLSQYYNKKSRAPVEYEATPDGFVVRKNKLRNPWGPVVKKQQLKSWSVGDIKEGDLFYFAVPFDDVRITAIEQVVAKTRRHLAYCKKAFVTTPQSAKGRRWFMYDMMNNVLPQVEDQLQKLLQLLELHGEANIKFPLFLFREKEMHLGERAVHCGNLIEVVDQIAYYFAQNPSELLGVDPSFVHHVEERMQQLSAKKFSGDERLPQPSSDDEGLPGHGGLSSDSDG